jgi:acetylornithine deacetylase
MSPPLSPVEITSRLVAIPSVSRDSNVPATELARDLLLQLGFEVEWFEYRDAAGVRKASVVGRRGPVGESAPKTTAGFAYFCHTDTVPAETWHEAEHGAWSPVVRDGRLYGRGSCDMKGSLACCLAASALVPVERLFAPQYIVCTADEEVGSAGAAQVARESRFFREMVERNVAGVIGEPTRLDVVHAHKGIYGFRAISRGRAAHSATGKGLNANLAMIPFLVEMRAIHEETERDPRWQNADFEPPLVSWNIGINDHNPAVNITAERSVCTVAFRPMPGVDGDALLERARSAAKRCGLEFEISWRGQPLHTDPQSEFVRAALALTGGSRSRTVPYGTDGVMLGDLRNLIVCGPGDIAQAHTRDEFIELEQLEQGTDLYRRMIERWCGLANG